MANEAPTTVDRYHNNNAPITRARRKSANDGVVNHRPKSIVPIPKSARKAERPRRNMLLPQPERTDHSITTLSSKDTDVDMVENYSVLPLVVSRDDDEYHGVIASNMSSRNDDSTSTPTAIKGGATTTSVVTTTTTTNVLPNPTLTSIAEKNDDNEPPVPVFTVLPTLDDLHTKMQQLFFLTTPGPIQYDNKIDWKELIFHRVCVMTFFCLSVVAVYNLFRLTHIHIISSCVLFLRDQQIALCSGTHILMFCFVVRTET